MILHLPECSVCGKPLLIDSRATCKKCGTLVYLRDPGCHQGHTANDCPATEPARQLAATRRQQIETARRWAEAARRGDLSSASPVGA